MPLQSIFLHLVPVKNAGRGPQPPPPFSCRLIVINIHCRCKGDR